MILTVARFLKIMSKLWSAAPLNGGNHIIQ